MTMPPTSAISEASAPAAEMCAPERVVDPQPAERRSIWPAIRTGLLASAACHAVLVLWGVGMWNRARPLAATPPPSIAVDIVSSNDAPSNDAPREPDQAAPGPEKQVALPDLLRPSSTAAQNRPAPISHGLSVSPDTGSLDAQVALANRLAEALQLPVSLPGGEPDTRPAESRAKLARDIIGEFKSHLGRCWTAPAAAAVAARLRVVIRVAFKPDGALLKEPMLIQAVASSAGPALVKNAIKALRDCQPYAFLPADKYAEWKVIDVAFTPEGIL